MLKRELLQNERYMAYVGCVLAAPTIQEHDYIKQLGLPDRCPWTRMLMCARIVVGSIHTRTASIEHASWTFVHDSLLESNIFSAT
jgi:hypothetical protein